MLKNIPACLSPELVAVLMRMGHGDEIVLGDANFPGDTCNDLVLRADGLDIPQLLDAILTLMPLDRYNDWQIGLMATIEGDPTPEVWATYEQVIRDHEGDYVTHYFERFDFYDQAKQTFAVVVTGETALYGNIILKKGVVV
ncbi:MAG: RbsD/FucU domain-containing protein [Actinomycetaceae bacterium]|nr:RbsD/FucU domain-containing protein [Actinomycetaceae bacterium]MDU0970775.1 RbsD/FucU domain-containing protein [Actinomycetaceae bacterium]